MYEDIYSDIIGQLQHAKSEGNTVVIQVNKNCHNHSSVLMAPLEAITVQCSCYIHVYKYIY